MNATEQSGDRQILLAMPLLRTPGYDLGRIAARLRDYWDATVEEDKAGQNDKAATLVVDGHDFVLMEIGIPVPDGEFDSLFPVSYLWENAERETAAHRSHMIVTKLSNDKPALENHRVFTKVVESILAETDSLGLYQGTQSLLISRENYQDAAATLKNGETPLMLWIFIGMPSSDQGQSFFTYGLTGFGKWEMEIVESRLDPDELFQFFVNVCMYVVNSDVTFEDGETLGYTEEIQARITISDGVFLEGKTIKIVM